MGTLLRSGFRRLNLATTLLVCASVRMAGFSALLLSGWAALPIVASAEVAPPRAKAGGLPFSADDAVRYFTRVLEVPPRRGEQGGTVFDSSNVRLEERYRVIVDQEGDDVVVSLSAGGDYGVNLIREFFESPLFDRDESEQLYRVLNGTNSGQTLRLKRFSVSARSWDTRDRYHLVLRFFQSERAVALARPRRAGFPFTLLSERNRNLSRYSRQERYRRE